MKLIIRASVLCLAMAGAFAGIASSHAAKAQTLSMSHMAVSSAMPTPQCEPGAPCNLHGK
jgi:hypothetical protein